ncbi:MAG: hypothetical protein K2X27_01120 [Candidatus Obscuribacterales bacterium]|nr:hypothetical protein [Candidatus Obscuribacterales bacterium]
MHSLALKEAEALGKQDAHYAFSLADLGFLDLRQHRFRQAFQNLEHASIILEKLWESKGGNCSKDLLASEFLRVELGKSRCLELLNKPEEAESAYFHTLEIFNAEYSAAKSPDLAMLFRFKDAFCAYCRLVASKKSLELASRLLSNFKMAQISHELSRESPDSLELMEEAFTQLVESTTASENSKRAIEMKFAKATHSNTAIEKVSE